MKAKKPIYGHIIFGVLIIVIALIVGTAYWSYESVKTMVSSAFEAAKGAKSLITPFPVDSAKPNVEVSAKLKLAMPKDNVLGQDLSEAPPYPGSMRTGFSEDKTQKQYIIDYFIPTKGEEILRFYKNYLKDWDLISEGKTSLMFKKGASELNIEIVAEDQESGVTHYLINLSQSG